MKSIRIIFTSIAAAVSYGCFHDQVTVRICEEYFTIGHPPLIHTESLTLLALFWGVIATWWVGLPLGIGLAFSARFGIRDKLVAGDLYRPLVRLLLLMLGAAILAGCIGYIASRAGVARLLEPMASRVAQHRHDAFISCLWAHSASYLFGIVGGITLCIKTWRRRKMSALTTN